MPTSCITDQPADQGHNPSRWRVTVTAFAAVAFGSTGIFAAITVAPLVAVTTTGSTTLSGLPTAAIGVGSVAGATLVSRTTASRGRRGGLLLGYGVGAAGAVLAVVAVAAEVFALFVGGMLLVGLANSAVLQARFAAADLSPVRWRASVLSWVLWAGTIGAVAGPSMVSPAGDLLSGWGVPSLAGGFTVAALAFMFSALCCMALPRLSPIVPGEAAPALGSMERRDSTAHTAWASPMLLIALTTMIVSQIVLASIQTMTPVQAAEAGVALREVGLIMSAHIVGMYAFTPVAGWVADRMGSLWAIVVGLVMMASASVIAGVVVVAAITPLAISLFVLGLGWSFGFVAASGMLTHEASFVVRARLQGLADTWVFAGATVAILGSGVVFSTVGFRTLCMAAAALIAIPAAAIARNTQVLVRASEVRDVDALRSGSGSPR